MENKSTSRETKSELDEAKEIVKQAHNLMERYAIPPFPACGNLSGIDTLAGANVYVRNRDQIANILQQPSAVLDWGCGYGQMSWLLANKGYKVTSTDLPNTYHEKSNLLKHKNISWIPASEPPIINSPTNSFDAIISSGVLEHVPNIQASMNELCRVLKPGGYLFIFRFPNEYSYIEWFARRSISWHHPILMSPRELHFLMKMNSLEVLDWGYDTILPVNCMNPYTRWLRPFRERFNTLFSIADKILTHIPLLSKLSTSSWLIAKKVNDYISEDTDISSSAKASA